MVQWPGRRGKMVKWRTPFGQWASIFIYGTYAFVGWNCIPLFFYWGRRRTYQQEYLEGKHKRSWDQLSSTEAYFAFYGWSLSNQRKRRFNFDNWTIEELELEEGIEPAKLLHELPAAEVARRDFETRQKKIDDMRKSVLKESLRLEKIPFERVVYSSNAYFEC